MASKRSQSSFLVNLLKQIIQKYFGIPYTDFNVEIYPQTDALGYHKGDGVIFSGNGMVERFFVDNGLIYNPDKRPLGRHLMDHIIRFVKKAELMSKSKLARLPKPAWDSLKTLKKCIKCGKDIPNEKASSYCVKCEWEFKNKVKLEKARRLKQYVDGLRLGGN